MSNLSNHVCISLFIFIGLTSGASAGCVPSLTTESLQYVCIGKSALAYSTPTGSKVAVGNYALVKNTTGDGNVAVGLSALSSNTTGAVNVAVGRGALANNVSSLGNRAIGNSSMISNTVGNSNIASGEFALRCNDGSLNTAYGNYALLNNTTGNNNIAIGYYAGSNLTEGSNNIHIGNPEEMGEGSTIRIGQPKKQSRRYIAGIRNVSITSGVNVVVGKNGQLGVVTSLRRYKTNIRPMDDLSQTLLALKPVVFRSKQETSKDAPLHYGLIAEDVDQVMPDFVIRNDEEEIETVAYQELPSILLNAYQTPDGELASAKKELADTNKRLGDALNALNQTEAKVEVLNAEMKALKTMLQRTMQLGSKVASITPVAVEGDMAVE